MTPRQIVPETAETVRSTPACVPFGYVTDFLRMLAERKDEIEVLTYADFPWGDDWDLESSYPQEFKNWQAQLASGERDPKKIYVVIQHDVDDAPERTHALLEVQEQLGIRSTVMIFNRRIDRQLLEKEGVVEYKPYDIDEALLRRLEAKGWVIAYHANAYEQSGFDRDAAVHLFEEDVAALRERYGRIEFFCPHGGARDAKGVSNASLDLPASLRPNLRWVLNRYGPKFGGRYSDGGLNSWSRDPSERDLRDFVKTWRPGQRYRILLHPQYYGDPMKRTKRLTGVPWYEEVLATYDAGQGASAWSPFLRSPERDIPFAEVRREKALVRPGRPIFIGGDGRSGTTLLNVVLDSSPALAVGPELHFAGGGPDLGPYVLETLRLLRIDDPRVRSKNLAKNPDLKPGVQFIRRVERAGIDFDEIAGLVVRAMRHTDSNLETFAERCALIHELGDRLRSKAGKKRWGFKIMREIRNPRKYAEVWPEAQFIHIIRDGRDVAASQMLEHASWGYGDLVSAASGWTSIIDECRKNSAGLSMLEVRYEDLVTDPEPALRRILEFLDVPWSDDVMRHHEVDHAFFHTRVKHPSRAATQQPINNSAVGRFGRDLTPGQIIAFEREAGPRLDELGYARWPGPDEDEPRVVRVDLETKDACHGLRACHDQLARTNERLVGRYFGRGTPGADQIHAGILDLRDLSFDDYIALVKRRYKGNVVRDARKADKAGYVCHPFARPVFIPDIVEINHSKAVRCGGEMRPAYLKDVEMMGGPPQRLETPGPPACPRHYDIWWGLFAPTPGYRQGDVVTDEKLLAYIDFRRIGSMALYSLIIGHGDHLNQGIMYRLHFAVMEWLCARDSADTRDLDVLMYAGFRQGGDGLRLWKKKTAFGPGLIVVDEQAPTPHVTRGWWRRLRQMIR